MTTKRFRRVQNGGSEKTLELAAKIFHESWSIMSRDTLDCWFCYTPMQKAWKHPHPQRQSIIWSDCTVARYAACKIPVWHVQYCQRLQPSHWSPSWCGWTGNLHNIHRSMKVVVLSFDFKRDFDSVARKLD